MIFRCAGGCLARSAAVAALVLVCGCAVKGGAEAGRDDASRARLQRVLAAANEPPTLAEAAALVAAGQAEQATAVYAQILARHPASVEALNGKGVALAQQGKLAEAATVLRQAVAERPQDVPARANLALVLTLAGETTQAQAMLEGLDRSAQGPAPVRASLALLAQ
ncbi:exported protein of unknown function [Rhodovastum atsumiense]|nr:tetratricopeptide repeat protein [Rhodovastum atsumiense]CAH2602013.1 exported protein of unknown function [Rhodovastum atsumiense]